MMHSTITRILLFLACSAGMVAARPQDNLELQLRRDLAVLADDSMRGRATPSPGLESAAVYVAARFAELELQPFGDPAFIERYPITDTEIIADSIRVAFPPAAPVGVGSQLALLYDHGAPASLEGDVVLLSGSITAATLAHIDLGGKNVVIPRPADYGVERLQQLAGPIMASNPYAMVFVTALPDSVMAALNTRRATQRRSLGVDPLDLRPPLRVSHGIFVLRPEVVSPILSKHGLDLSLLTADTSGQLNVRTLPSQQLRTTAPRRTINQLSAPNVVAIIPGSDPVLRNEFVMVSAHLDHLGVGKPTATGDSIYNGADDNASGVAVMLSIAAQIQQSDARPRRSIVFVATSGEEAGLWGSDFFVGAAATPVERIVANINIDGVGRAAWPDSIAVLGGAWSTLGAAALRAAEKANAGLTPTFAPHAPYSGSDQYSSARRGIPSVHIYSGKLNAYYHTPADDLAVIDFRWLTRVARYTREFVEQVANAAGKPAWTDPYRAEQQVPW